MITQVYAVHVKGYVTYKVLLGLNPAPQKLFFLLEGVNLSLSSKCSVSLWP